MGQTNAEARAQSEPDVAWRAYPNQTFAAVLRAASGACYRLTVEAVADECWEWLAWSAVRPAHCANGTAAAAAEARQAAEAAAERMLDRPLPVALGETGRGRASDLHGMA